MDIDWRTFESREPELAAHGRRLLYPFGNVGLGMLATTRADGGPRVHPVCPALQGDGLFVFVIGDSPKRRDLARDGRYALHAFPSVEDDESFYCTGRAVEVVDPVRREIVAKQMAHHVKPSEALFALLLERVLHTRWLDARTPSTRPVYTRWRADPEP